MSSKDPLRTLGEDPDITNLDAAVTIFKLVDGQSPEQVATINPQDEILSGSYTAELPSTGNYSIAVAGVGDGDAATTGYSNYGCLGPYKMTLTWRKFVPNPGAGFFILTIASGPLASTDRRGRTAAAVTFNAIEAGARVTKMRLMVSCTWNFTAAEGSGKPVTTVSRTLVVGTRALGSFTLRSPRVPLAAGKVSIIIVGINVLGRRAGLIKYFPDASDVIATASFGTARGAHAP